MNTQAFEQFNVMDNEALSTVEGGGMIRCALGTAGSAGLGFVGGMGAGTVLSQSLVQYLERLQEAGLEQLQVLLLFVEHEKQKILIDRKPAFIILVIYGSKKSF